MAKFLRCTPLSWYETGGSVLTNGWLVNTEYIVSMAINHMKDEDGNYVTVVYAHEPMWDEQDERVHTYVVERDANDIEGFRRNIIEL